MPASPSFTESRACRHGGCAVRVRYARQAPWSALCSPALWRKPSCLPRDGRNPRLPAVAEDYARHSVDTRTWGCGLGLPLESPKSFLWSEFGDSKGCASPYAPATEQARQTPSGSITALIMSACVRLAVVVPASRSSRPRRGRRARIAVVVKHKTPSSWSGRAVAARLFYRLARRPHRDIYDFSAMLGGSPAPVNPRDGECPIPP